MIYNFHHFYYWSKGGVETGQAYRAKVFRKLGLEARFVYATTFPYNNIWKETEYLGFSESEVMWLYGFFTDCKKSSSPYTLEQLEATFDESVYDFSQDGRVIKYRFPNINSYYIVYMLDDSNRGIHRVEVIEQGHLIRRDFYTYCKIYSEYFVQNENGPYMCLRRFFHENGAVAFEEMVDEDMVLYKFPDRILYSREELVGYMMSQLHLTEDDVVLIDGEPGMIECSAFIVNAAPAKVGLVLHSNHYIEYDEEHIYWYGIYEYAFSHAEKIDFFITNTEAQSNLLREQFRKYKGIEPRILTIPVMALDKLRVPEEPRKRHALISAGRLAPEKYMDWVIKAVVAAKAQVQDLSLDIYGEGKGRQELQNLIDTLNCGDYVHLCGFQKLDEVYQKYDAYISASYGETFGVTLLEAVGSGLPIVSFNLPYGAWVFIEEGKNGYTSPWNDIEGLTKGIIKLFTEADMESFRNCSYEKAKMYLTEEVDRRWKELLCPIK